MPRKVTEIARKQRKPRAVGMPPLDIDTTVPYAECREEFSGENEVDFALAIIEHPVYQQIMLPALDELEQATRGKRGPRRFYAFHELEKLLLYQRLAGFADYDAARTFLAGDKGGPHRRKLGFDLPRDRTPGRRSEARDGVPCKRTIDRYLNLWPDGERAALLDRIMAAVRDQWLTTAEAREECRRLSLDGSVYRTHYVCPPGFDKDGQPLPRWRKHRKTGEKVNTVTCHDGGYIGGGGGPEHAGDGWNVMPLITGRGRVLDYKVVPNCFSEKTVARDVVRAYGERIRPLLAPTEITVLSADGGFHSGPLRRECREVGIMANIPVVSGNGGEAAERNRKRKEAKRLLIEDHPGWEADGFRELHCRHGKVPTSNRSFLHPDGPVVERIEGQCRQGCGTCTITNGDYRVAQNPGRLVRRRPSDPPHERDDELFGTPLTQNSKLAKAFGGKRWGKHENFNSMLHTRFGMLTGKSWIRKRDRAHQNVALTFMAQWVLSDIAEQRRQSIPPAPLPAVPPPSALPLAA